jgi:hypothetical protein
MSFDYLNDLNKEQQQAVEHSIKSGRGEEGSEDPKWTSGVAY